MLVPVLLFIVGLVCLIKGGAWFVDGASALARKVEEATRPSGPKGLSPQAQGRAQDAGETRGQANGAARGAIPQTSAETPKPAAQRGGGRRSPRRWSGSLWRRMSRRTRCAM